MRARESARVIDGIGGELRTLLDAGRYVDALPRSMHEREEWKTVMEVLSTLRYSRN
jgi:hypothetical protein